MIRHLEAAPAARYAIYHAPRPDSVLWQAGCRWLGRNPATGEVLDQPAVPGMSGERLHRLTASARLYGLHATLKPPFHLAPGRGHDALDQALEQFAGSCPAPRSLHLRVAPLSGFLALQPVDDDPALLQFASACVAQFDAFRAPPDEAELARRRAAGLNARQEALLLQFGYPYVLDQFRFHITLTDRLTPEDRASLQPWLAAHLADALREPLTLSDICLFVQPAPQAPFRLLRRYPLQSR